MTEIISGRFEIGAPLGKGSTGIVYRGLDQQTGQPVAIKLLNVTPSRDSVERFIRESEALRRLKHPNIVNILALITENNRAYMVTDYVGGGSLADWLARESKLPINTVLHIALGLADALTRAHHLNIIHGDISPANVLLAEDGTARLTDFGLTRLKSNSASLTTGQTVETLLTPREQDILRLVTDGRSNKEIAQHLTVTPGTVKWYISEIYGKLGVHTRTQAIARARELSENKLAVSPQTREEREPDARSDGAFGAMLYEMLAGRQPSASETTAIAIRTLRPETPPELVALISRMLDKDQDKRLTSMQQVSAELEAMMQRELPISAGAIVASPTSESRIATSASPLPIRRSLARNRLIWMAGIVVILLIGLVALVARNRGNAAVPAVQEAAGDYIVLVAPFEAVRTEARDVGRFIADDLKQQLEVEVPFSKMRVSINPDVITTDDEARAAAQAAGASVVVWGNYTADKVATYIQVGGLEAFKYNQFDRATLERTANVRAEMTDETKQSVAPQVLGVLALLSFADGDQYGTGRAVAALETIQVDEAAFVGNSVAVRVHRYFQTPTADLSKALDEINAALADDLGNAILYTLRSQTHLRTLDANGLSTPNSLDAKHDAETAQLLGPKDWAMPSVLLSLTYDQSVMTYLNQIVERRPDDWFAYFTRSANYYDQGDFDHARADIEQAMALKPDVNFPYMLAMLIAWREGRLADAATYSNFALNNLRSTPDFLKRIFDALWGSASIYAPLPPNNLLMFHYLILGQYDDARQAYNLESRTFLHGIPTITNGDSIVLFGITYCNLGDATRAGRLYDIDLSSTQDRDNMLAYLLRAQAENERGNRKLALLDIAIMQSSVQADAFAPFAAAVMNGDFGCKDLFNPQKIAEILQKYGGVKAADLAATLTAVPTIMPTETPDPSAVGDYTVLVAPFEAIRTEARDVGRFIADDLKQQLEVEAPFSKMRVHINPAMITSDDDARAAAQAAGASVVVWGNYTADKVTTYIQVGSLEAFKYNQFDRATLERTANVRAEMTDETKQSVAPQVLGVLALLSFADGDQYGTGRAIAALETLQVDEAAFVGNSVAVRVHRYFQMPTADASKSLDEINAALGDDSGNAILYTLRSRAKIRTLNPVVIDSRDFITLDDAKRDAETARRLGPSRWVMPLILQYFSSRAVDVTLLDQIIEQRPDDWSAYFTRSSYYYDLGDFAHARVDIEQSIGLQPDVNIPYVLATLIAWREGRLADAAAYSDFAVNKLPAEPDLLRRIFDALWGDSNSSAPTPPYNIFMFHHLILGQYDDARLAFRFEARRYHDTTIDYANGDAIVLFGIAYCGLGDYTRAAQLYKIDLGWSDRDNMLVYLLDAYAQFQHGNRRAVRADVEAVLKSSRAAAFAPFAAAAMNGEFGCTDLFNSQKIAEIMQKYGTVKAADIAATLTAVPTATLAPSATP